MNKDQYIYLKNMEKPGKKYSTRHRNIKVNDSKLGFPITLSSLCELICSWQYVLLLKTTQTKFLTHFPHF